MKIMIEHTPYELDFASAIALRVLTILPKKRPINITDIPNGGIFKWQPEYQDGKIYLMLDKSLQSNGQCVCIDGTDSYLTFFTNGDNSVGLSLLKNNSWVTEINN